MPCARDSTCLFDGAFAINCFVFTITGGSVDSTRLETCGGSDIYELSTVQYRISCDYSGQCSRLHDASAASHGRSLPKCVLNAIAIATTRLSVQRLA